MKNFTLLLIGIFSLFLFMVCCKKKDSNGNKKPILNIVTPNNNDSIYKGDSIIIRVQANDPDGLIKSIDFFVDYKKLSQSNFEPYKYVWHSNDIAGGQHKITVIATDNENLSDSISVMVRVMTKNPIVITSPVLFVGTTLAICGGNVTSSGIPFINVRGVCWNKLGAPTVNDNKGFVVGDTGLFVYQLKGLELGTKYFIRAYAQNVDTIVYGSEVNLTTSSCYFSDSGSFIDNRDLTKYKWVTIGSQTWMAENLRYNSASAIKYQTYNDSVKYGYLYIKEDANNSCPQGWHLPDSTEWIQLINYVGGVEVAGSFLKTSGPATWKVPNINTTNNSFFSVLPGGYYYYRRYSDFGYVNIGLNGYFVVKGKDNYYYYDVELDNDSNNVQLRRYYPDRQYYFSVRCIKD